MENLPTGIVHFSGHGRTYLSIEGFPTYNIVLENSELDVMTWRGLVQGSRSAQPFYFFNACGLADVHIVADFVEGWAPAVLDAGASGYIGGMWPLADRSAARFAARFYGSLEQGMKSGPTAIASALQDARRLFYETGDPTYLAYAYYGDVNLRFVGN